VMQEVTMVGGWNVHESVTNNSAAMSVCRKPPVNDFRF
jgi:hypothetical protein